MGGFWGIVAFIFVLAALWFVGFLMKMAQFKVMDATYARHRALTAAKKEADVPPDEGAES